MEQLQGPTRKNRRRIIAGIPAYNEAKHIGDVVFEALRHVDEVIVVDDGSRDDTARIAKAAGATVIRSEINQGPGQATKTCFRLAKERKADVLVTLDGDGQHNPEEIPGVMAPILDGRAYVVIGSRFLNRENNIPMYRRFGISAINLLFNFATTVRMSDSQSGFRAYSDNALNLLNITEKGFGFSIELLLQAGRKGLAIAEVPISCIYRSTRHSLNPVIHGLVMVLAVFRLRTKLFVDESFYGGGRRKNHRKS